MKVLLATVVALTTVILCGAADPECTKRKTSGRALHWANPDDCGRFYRCSVKNVKREVICPPAKEYNAKTGKCSPQGKGTCKLSAIEPTTFKPTADADIADADVANAADVNEANVCNGVASGKFLPKANSCREFYICNENVSIQQTCNNGSRFDSINGNCIPDGNKTCWQNKCIGQKDRTYLPDAKDCLRFYICQNNEAVVQNCDIGSYFDATNGNCVPDDYQKCWKNKCIGQKNGTYMPDYDSCLSFYICQSNQTVLQNCNSGSFFNATSLNCIPDVNNTNCWENYCLARNNGDLLANNDDCYKYYKCQDKQAIVETCPVGSYFNKLTLSCENGICPGESTTEMTTESTDDGCTCPGGYREGDIVPHPKSCNRFYICYKGKLLAQSCLMGNSFNASLGACTRDIHGICADSMFRNVAARLKRSTGDEIAQKDEINEESLNESVVVVAAEEPTETKETEQLPVISEEPKATPAPPKCLGLYQEGDFVADPADCQKFHICIGGALKEQTCGLGNYFDGREKLCKADAKGLCGPKLMAVNPGEAIAETPNTKNQSCTCPGGYVGGDILPHPTDCDKFYVCFDSELRPSECGVGNRFNKAKAACMPDTNGTCWPKTTTNPALNCTCPGGYVEGEMVPYPDNSRLYYICVDGKLVESDCGTGNRYNNSQQACMSDTNDSSSSSICKNQPNNVMLPNPANCGSFYLCLKGIAMLQNCGSEEWFDPSTSSCVEDINAKCKNPCANTKGITLLPHPVCFKFYICNNGQATVGNCKAGEGFISQLQTCSQGGCSSNSSCFGKHDGTTFPVPNDTHSFYYCLDGVEMKRRCGNDTIYNEKFRICMLQPSTDCNQQLCANATDGTIAPTISCDGNNSFCECRNGSAFKHSCPTGYTFNAHLNICYSDAPCDPLICVNSPDYQPYANRKDNQSFCLCVDKEPVIVKCPKNGTYHPKLRLCRQPAAQDPNCNQNVCLTASPNSAFSSNTADSSNFCICIDGGAVHKKCMNGSVFSAKYGVCLPVEMECDVTKCSSGTTMFFSAADDKDSFCYCVDNRTVHLVKCPSRTRYDDTFKACLADPCEQSYCLDPSHAFTVYPSNANLHIFCYCNGNHATWRACGKGTVFNNVTKACIPDVPDCDIKLCANATIGNAFPVPAKNDSHGFCYCSSSVSVTKLSCPEGKSFDPTKGICIGNELCEGKYKQYQSIANPAACNKYRVCLNTTMLDLTCGNGMYYNNATNQCLPDDNDQCKITEGSNCTCPGGYEEGTFVPHPVECQKFYICAESKLQQADCGDGNVFNKTLGYCVRDLTGICRQNSTRTCVGTYREGDLVPNPDDPQMYFICYNAHLQAGNCGNGNIFDPKLLHCVSGLPGIKQRTHAITKRSSTDQHDKNCIEGAKRSVPANCSQYETCFNGNWTRTTCSQHLYYSSDKQLCLEPRDDTICDFARVAGLPPCKEENENHLMPTRNQQCGSYLRCSRRKWRLKNCPKQQYFSVSLQTCIATENSAVCHIVETTIQPNSTAIEEAVKCAHTQVRFYQPNCAMYYMCLEGEWWIQYCPLGMYFNRTQNYCVPNNNGQCETAEMQPQSPPTGELTQSNCIKEGALRASTTSCEKYYVCVAGMWFQQTCALRQYFNKTQVACVAIDGSCVSSNLSLCNSGSRRAVPLNCTAYKRCSDDGASWLRFDCSTNHYFDEVLEMCVPNDGSCASSGLRRACHVGDLKPHPDKRNCGEFLHCEAQIGWQLNTCLKGYTYAQSVQACLLGLRDGNCTLSKPGEENTTALPEENPCLGKMDGVSVAHVSDCNKFHICLNETKTKVQTCSNGSFFDEILSYCRPNDGTCRLPLSGPCEGQLDGALVANSKNCSSYYLCSTINGTQLQQCALGEYFHNVTRQCRQDKGECRKPPVVSICAGKQHGARLPHEKNCNIYYACVRGAAIQVECPDKQKFNEVLHRCIPDAEHECQNGLLVVSNSTQTCANLTDGAFVVDRHDCSRYYICSAQKALHKRCIAGSYFDAKQMLCMPDNGSCPFVDSANQIVPPDPIVCVGRHGDLLPDPANCNEFYVCINGKLRPERCYEHNFFNVTTNECQLRVNLTSNSTETSLTKVVTPQQCQQQPTNLTSFCAKLELGTSLAEQADCRRYITCNEGEANSQRCRNGESFDSILGVCRQNDGTCQLENGERVGDCNGKHGQITRNVDNCRGYFVCINGQKIIAECAKDEYFNRTLNLCQRDVLLQCNITANEAVNQTSVNVLTTLKRYPEEKLCANSVIGQRYVNIIDSCRSFYICLENGTVQHEHCPEGSLFHSLTSKCEDAELFPCNKTLNNF